MKMNRLSLQLYGLTVSQKIGGYVSKFLQITNCQIHVEETGKRVNMVLKWDLK